MVHHPAHTSLHAHEIKLTTYPHLTPKLSITGNTTIGATPAAKFHAVTGQYEFGNVASLTLNSALIRSAAAVMEVLLMLTRKQTRLAVRAAHHLRRGRQCVGWLGEECLSASPSFGISSLFRFSLLPCGAADMSEAGKSFPSGSWLVFENVESAMS